MDLTPARQVLLEVIDMKMNGYFSQKAKDIGCGTCFYVLEDGSVKEVTAIFKEGRENNYLWPDKVCVGPIHQYRCPGQKSVFYSINEKYRKDW